jgi:ADP-ribose pyrophosphatase YjhB (NUDIX family)
MAISGYLRGLRERIGHELLLVPSATGIVFDAADRILLVRHAHGGVWVAPGGAVDPDETPADALVREVWEETGLWVEPTRLLGVFGGPDFRVTYANGDQVSYVMSLFECEPVGGELRVDGEAITEARFIGETELGKLTIPEWARRVLPPIFHRNRPNRGFTPPSWRPPER